MPAELLGYASRVYAWEFLKKGFVFNFDASHIQLFFKVKNLISITVGSNNVIFLNKLQLIFKIQTILLSNEFF